MTDNIYNPAHIEVLKQWFNSLNGEDHGDVLDTVAAKAGTKPSMINWMFASEGSIPRKKKHRILTTMTTEYKKYKNLERPK